MTNETMGGVLVMAGSLPDVARRERSSSTGSTQGGRAWATDFADALPAAEARALFVITMTEDAEAEARAFGRHLVGVLPEPELLARYRDACARLFPDPPDGVDAALLGFATRHPWSVGPLDAATGLLRPGSLLRAKILVMAAVLETTTRFADEFLPRSPGRLELAGRLGVIGVAAALRALAGVALYGLIRARA